MPFKLRITALTPINGGLRVSGEVVEGGFSGPEAVCLFSVSGEEIHGIIARHGLENPKDWPVVPGDGATLHLDVSIGKSQQIDVSKPLIGRGTIVRATKHVDFTQHLDMPAFWATQIGFHVEPHLEERDIETAAELFGLSQDELDDYYATAFEACWSAGEWPRIRAPLPGGRYVEYESAAGIEYQQRYWIGDNTRHVLAGYYSGHFSTPALRPAEILSLAQLWQPTRYRYLPLLLLTVSYVDSSEPKLRALVHELVRSAPWLPERSRGLLEASLLESAHMTEVQWSRHPKHGWVNDWRYSQRNPESSMSILQPEDFAFIERFFSA